MKAIFAPGHLQSNLHLGPTSGRRLERFLELLRECGVDASFPSLGDLRAELAEADIVIATTRTSDFSATELEMLVDAVTTGRSLLHLSNHKPFPLYDSQLSKRFGYSFKNLCFVDRDRKMPFDFKVNLGALPGYNHSLDTSKTVSINNCCSIAMDNDRFNTVAVLPEESCINAENGETGGGEIFAIAREKSANFGRVFAMADSGLIGEPFGKYPGPGLGAGENYETLREIIRWLVQ